jgi:oligosaccharide repeat unit polymerase
MCAFLLTAFAILAVLNYWIGRDPRYPPFLMSAVWLLVLIVYYMAPAEVFPVGLATSIIFILATMAFSAGGLITFRVFAPSTQTESPSSVLRKRPPLHPRVKKFLLGTSVLLLPFMINRAIWLAAQSGIEQFFIGLRVEISLPDSIGYGLIANASTLSYITTFLYFVEVGSGVREKWQRYFSLLISVIYAVLSTGRTSIFLILVALMGILWMRRRFSLKMLIAIAMVSVLAFSAFAVALKKGADPDAPWSENIGLIRESLVIYVVGALPAFDVLVKKDAPLEYGETTFSAWINIVRRVTGRPLISPIQEEVFVPFPINVYTAIQPAYKDFGIVGVILIFTLIGALSSYFYAKALAGDLLHIYYYSLSLFPLLLSAFTDQYFASMVSWMKFLLAGYLYFRWRSTSVSSRDSTAIQALSTA